MSTPDEIELESISDLADSRVVETIDYIVTGGDVYAIVVNDYAGKQHLKRVPEVPKEYWERYDE